MDALEKWEENLKTLERLTRIFALLFSCDHFAMPFKSEYVSVEKIDEFVKYGIYFRNSGAICHDAEPRYSLSRQRAA